MQSWQDQNLIKLNAASAVRGRMRKYSEREMEGEIDICDSCS